MITLLSPAKRLDMDTPPPTRKHTMPRLLDHSAHLIEILRGYTVADVARLLHISDELAALNVQRYHDWEPPLTPANARPAAYAFAGDTYVGLDARARFDARDLTAAQKSLRILSGLYGVLRPLDLIQAYRLEMGTALPTSRGATLYDFWRPALTDLLRDDLDASPGSRVVVNLASAEYAGAVEWDRLDARVVTPRFEDEAPDGSYKVISLYAKQARGDMAGWLITQRARSARAVRDYDGRGYALVPSLSTPAEPVFRRPRSAA